MFCKKFNIEVVDPGNYDCCDNCEYLDKNEDCICEDQIQLEKK